MRKKTQLKLSLFFIPQPVIITDLGVSKKESSNEDSRCGVVIAQCALT